MCKWHLDSVIGILSVPSIYRNVLCAPDQNTEFPDGVFLSNNSLCWPFGTIFVPFFEALSGNSEVEVKNCWLRRALVNRQSIELGHK